MSVAREGAVDIVVDVDVDVDVFGDANHELLVIGTTEEGFRLWCRQCDRMGERVYARKGYAADKVFFPCVVLSIDDEQERDLGGTTGSDDWGFPVKVER